MDMADQLKNGDVQTRLGTLKSLSGSNDEAAILLIIDAMGDSEWRVRQEAVSAIAKVEDKVGWVHRLIERIADNSNVGRRNAAAELFVQWGSLSVPPLLAHLNQVNEDTQKVLIDVLGDIRDPRAISPLVNDILGKGSLEEASVGFADNLRSAALEALGKIRPPEAVEKVIPFLNKANPLLTFSAIKALELIGSPLAVPHLNAISEDKMFKRAALEALGVIADINAMGCLLEGFHSEFENIRRVALKAIVRLEKQQSPDGKGLIWQSVKRIYNEQDYIFLLTMINHGDPLLKRSAIRVLGWASEVRSVPILISFLNEHEDDVVFSLIAMGSSILPELFKVLEQGVWEHENTRHAVAAVLGWLSSPESSVLLCNLLKDNSARVREAAANSLGKTKNIAAIRQLISLLRDPYPEVQEAAKRSLLEMESDLPIDDIIQLLEERSAHLRLNAALLLGEMRVERSMPGISFLLKDSAEDVRRAAVYALGCFLPSPFAVQSILMALGDEDHKVRVAVLKVLEQVSIDPIIDDLSHLVYDDNIWVRAAFARIVGMASGEEGLKLLLRLLDDPTGVVQIATLAALGQRQEAVSLDLILKYLSSKDRDVQRSAILALGTLGDPVALPALTPFLDDPHWDLRAAAATAVGKLNVSSLTLKKMADFDDDPLVRDAARMAMSALPSSH